MSRRQLWNAYRKVLSPYSYISLPSSLIYDLRHKYINQKIQKFHTHCCWSNLAVVLKATVYEMVPFLTVELLTGSFLSHRETHISWFSSLQLPI